MKTLFASVLLVAGLITAAQAEPVRLSADRMDQVSAAGWLQINRLRQVAIARASATSVASATNTNTTVQVND
jgi:hypothetical protein